MKYATCPKCKVIECVNAATCYLSHKHGDITYVLPFSTSYLEARKARTKERRKKKLYQGKGGRAS